MRKIALTVPAVRFSDGQFLPLRKPLNDPEPHGAHDHVQLILVHRHDRILPAASTSRRPRLVPAARAVAELISRPRKHTHLGTCLRRFVKHAIATCRFTGSSRVRQAHGR